MNRDVRMPPRWRAHDGRAFRPGPWLLSLAVVGMLLVEVWQSSTMTERVQELDKLRSELTRAEARRDYAEARLERLTTRTELAPLVRQLGLVPADASQIVHVPSEYLEGVEGERGETPPTLLAMAERASRVLVPEATARPRGDMNP